MTNVETLKHDNNQPKQPILRGAIPLINGGRFSTIEYFKSVLGSTIFTPDHWQQAQGLPQFERLFDKPQLTASGLLMNGFHMPNRPSPDGGITLFFEPKNETDTLPHAAFLGSKVQGCVFFYQMICCSTSGINAVVAAPREGQMAIQMRPSEEGYVNGHGFDFKGQVMMAGHKALQGLDCLWNELRGEACDHGHDHAPHNVKTLKADSQQAAFIDVPRPGGMG